MRQTRLHQLCHLTGHMLRWGCCSSASECDWCGAISGAHPGYGEAVDCQNGVFCQSRCPRIPPCVLKMLGGSVGCALAAHLCQRPIIQRQNALFRWYFGCFPGNPLIIPNNLLKIGLRHSIQPSRTRTNRSQPLSQSLLRSGSTFPTPEATLNSHLLKLFNNVIRQPEHVVKPHHILHVRHQRLSSHIHRHATHVTIQHFENIRLIHQLTERPLRHPINLSLHSQPDRLRILNPKLDYFPRLRITPVTQPPVVTLPLELVIRMGSIDRLLSQLDTTTRLPRPILHGLRCTVTALKGMPTSPRFNNPLTRPTASCRCLRRPGPKVQVEHFPHRFSDPTREISPLLTHQPYSISPQVLACFRVQVTESLSRCLV